MGRLRRTQYNHSYHEYDNVPARPSPSPASLPPSHVSVARPPCTVRERTARRCPYGGDRSRAAVVRERHPLCRCCSTCRSTSCVRPNIRTWRRLEVNSCWMSRRAARGIRRWRLWTASGMARPLQVETTTPIRTDYPSQCTDCALYPGPKTKVAITTAIIYDIHDYLI